MEPYFAEKEAMLAFDVLVWLGTKKFKEFALF